MQRQEVRKTQSAEGRQVAHEGSHYSRVTTDHIVDLKLVDLTGKTSQRTN